MLQPLLPKVSLKFTHNFPSNSAVKLTNQQTDRGENMIFLYQFINQMLVTFSKWHAFNSSNTCMYHQSIRYQTATHSINAYASMSMAHSILKMLRVIRTSFRKIFFVLLHKFRKLLPQSLRIIHSRNLSNTQVQ